MQLCHRLAVACALTLLAAPALASVPANVALDGRLVAAGGGPAADGSYAMTFRLYPNAAAKQAKWSESVAKVAVKGGSFRHLLGSVVKLDPAVLSAAQPAWLGVQVGVEPEMSRQPVRAAPFALRTEKASGVGCTGCLSIAALKPDGDLNLGGNAIKVAVVSVGAVVAGSVTAKSLAGDGAKITGVVPPAASCGPGQVVLGVANDGKLLCGANSGGGSGLEAASGGMLTTAFAEPIASKTTPKAIEDNNPIGMFDEIIVPDIGPAKKLIISVNLSNSNINGIKVVLYDPANAAYVLHDHSGNAKTLVGNYPSPDKTVSGDLSKWIGKNPKGKWRLRIIDDKFLNNGKDGQLNSWSVNLLSEVGKQVTSKGAFAASAGFGNQVSAGPPGPCNEDNVGRMYFDSKDKRMYYCDGDWRLLLIEPLCGNGAMNPGEECDDGNMADGDGCTAKCKKNICGDSVLHKGVEECDDGNLKPDDGCSPHCKILGYIPGFNGVKGPLFGGGWLQCEGYHDQPGGDHIPAAWGNDCAQAKWKNIRIVCGANTGKYRYLDIKKNVFVHGMSAYPEQGLIFNANYTGWENKLYAKGNHPHKGTNWWGGGSGCNESAKNITINNSCSWEAANCFGQGINGARYLWLYVKP